MKQCIVSLVAFLIVAVPCASAEAENVEEPKYHTFSKGGGYYQTITITDTYFSISQPDFLFQEFPTEIKVRLARGREITEKSPSIKTALNKKIWTQGVNIELYDLWKQRLIGKVTTVAVWVGGIILLFRFIRLYDYRSLTSQALRKTLLTIPLIILALSLVIWIGVEYCWNQVYLENASSKEYLVTINDNEFKLLAKHHVIIDLPSGTHDVIVRESPDSPPLHRTTIRIGTGSVLKVFNIANANTFIYQEAPYVTTNRP
jgi:hypothetical protein